MGTSVNQGIVIRPSDAAEVTIANTRDADISLRPTLEVALDVSHKSGIEMGKNVVKYDIGETGSAYINMHDQNMDLVYPLIKGEGDSNPLNIDLVYSDNFCADIGYGRGWKLNIVQMLYMHSNDTFSYIDENSSWHIFSHNNSGHIYESDNGRLTMYAGEDAALLLDEIGNIMIFEKSYHDENLFYMTNLRYDSGNEINIEYDLSIGTVISATDSQNEVMFDYFYQRLHSVHGSYTSVDLSYEHNFGMLEDEDDFLIGVTNGITGEETAFLYPYMWGSEKNNVNQLAFACSADGSAIFHINESSLGFFLAETASGIIDYRAFNELMFTNTFANDLLNLFDENADFYISIYTPEVAIYGPREFIGSTQDLDVGDIFEMPIVFFDENQNIKAEAPLLLKVVLDGNGNKELSAAFIYMDYDFGSGLENILTGETENLFKIFGYYDFTEFSESNFTLPVESFIGSYREESSWRKSLEITGEDGIYPYDDRTFDFTMVIDAPFYPGNRGGMESKLQMKVEMVYSDGTEVFTKAFQHGKLYKLETLRFSQDPSRQLVEVNFELEYDYFDGEVQIYAVYLTDANASEAAALKYTLINGGTAYRVSKFDNTISGAVDIPSVYNGLPVVEIEDYAFADCTAITYVKIPASVYRIGIMAFAGCSSLKSFHVDADNIAYKSDYGKVFSKDGAVLVNYPAGSDVTHISLSGNIREIGPGAFAGSANLEYVVLSSGITTVGAQAFMDSHSLKTVIINEGITEIKAGAFLNCTGLESVTLPESLEYIGERAFYYTINIEWLFIPDAVTFVGREAFAHWGRISSSLVQTIYANVKDTWSSNWDDYFNGMRFVALYYNVSFVDPMNLISLPDQKVRLGGYVTDPGITEVGNYRLVHWLDQFGNVFNFSTTKPSPLIGNFALTAVWEEIQRTCSVYFVFDGTMYYLYDVLSGNLIQEPPFDISGYYIEGWYSDAQFTSKWNFDTDTVNEDMILFCLKYEMTEGLEFTEIDGGYEVSGGGNEISGILYIPAYYNGLPVIRIADDGFAFGLFSEVYIPSTVTEIGAYAFDGCENLTYVELNKGLLIIGSYAFSYCDALESINLPSTVEEIGSYAFSGCTSILRLYIPESVSYVGRAAFYRWNNGQTIVIYGSTDGWDARWNQGVTANIIN